jgi:hypothetical protein
MASGAPFAVVFGFFPNFMQSLRCCAVKPTSVGRREVRPTDVEGPYGLRHDDDCFLCGEWETLHGFSMQEAEVVAGLEACQLRLEVTDQIR